jgi:two-component system nitrate/nitrite response regulator NarL
MQDTDRPIRVLLVDDHDVVRAGIRLILQGQDSITIGGEARDGKEALAEARSLQPDVIVLDLDLGDDSGLHIIPELLEASPQSRIVILTGVRDPQAQRQSILAGALGVVPKDRAADVLIKAIRRVNAGEAWLEPSLMAGVLSDVSRASRQKQTDPEIEKIASLTAREREVVALIGEGIRNKEIADRLFISETTVRHHLTSIFSKLEVSDRVELLVYAFKHGLAEPPQRKAGR